MDQLEQAVNIAGNPSSGPQLNQQAITYIHQVRDDPAGWQAGLELFTRTPRASEQARIVALDVLNYGIERRKAGPEDDVIRYIRQKITEHIQTNYGPGCSTDDNAILQNKLAQITTTVFVMTYLESWPTFFDDIMGLARSTPGGPWDNLPAVAFFLKVSASVHDEIADTLISRTPAEMDRNVLLKDTIRQRDVQKLVGAWQEVLEQMKGNNNQLAQLCLQVIGKWVSWIDISVVVNDTLLRLLFESMDLGGEVRSAALVTLTEIIGKKMRGPDKLQLISFLNVPDIIARISQSPDLQNPETMEYDEDLAELVAKLVNVVLTDVVIMMQKDELDQAGREKAEVVFQSLIPMLLRYLSDQFDEVSAAVFPVTAELLTLFKKEKKSMGSLSHQHAPILLPILNAIVKKMRYDTEATWGDEDEQTDEAEFEETRKKLKVLQDAIATIDEGLFRQCISELVEGTFQRVAESPGVVDWREIDLALYELFNFGEQIGKAGAMFAKGQASSPVAETLINMLGKMIACNVANYSHPAIRLKSMEVFVRYCPFFEVHTSLIPQALESFNKCIHDEHPRVRTRSWYLFYKYVRTLRQHMGTVAETMIRATDDLRFIRAELPPDEDATGADEMDSDAGTSDDNTFESQLYLFETVGCLASAPPQSPDVQTSLIQSTLTPVFSDIEQHIVMAENGDLRAVLQLHHDIMALGTIAKGFTDYGATTKPIPVNEPGLLAEFTKTTDVMLIALGRLNKYPAIREAARFTFARLVGALGDKVLLYVERWISGLMAKSSSKGEISMFLKALEQIVHNFKNTVFDILDGLLTPLLNGIFTSLAQPTHGTDDETEHADLRKEFLTFILVIINNNLGQTLVSDKNRENFDNVLQGIVHYAREMTDPSTQKIAFSVISKLSYVFGPSTAAEHRKTAQLLMGNNPPQEQPIPGFESIMLDRFAMLCWEVPYRAGFNPKDAGGRAVLVEIGGLHKMLYVKLADQYLQRLRQNIFPTINVQRGMEEFMSALQRMEVKDFKNFLQVQWTGIWSEHLGTISG